MTVIAAELDAFMKGYMQMKETPVTMTGRFKTTPSYQEIPKKERRNSTMIETLKTLTVAKYNLEELIELRAEARVLSQEYEAQTLQAPDWLKNASTTLDAEIKLRARDEKRRRLNEAKSRRAALATPEEKRAGLDAEIAALEESLT